MLARKKFSKKQIKEDKLVTSYYNALNFFQANQSKILIGVGIVAVLIVAVILFSNKRSSNNVTAAGLMAKVIPLYEASNYKDAIDGQKAANIVGLKKIVDDYGSTETGESAKIYLANSYVMIGNDQAAFDAYDSYSGSNQLFKSTALAGKAGCLEAKNEFEKAVDLYKDAAKISKYNPSNPEYLLKAAISLIKVGKKEEAKSLLDSIKKDYKTSPVLYELDKYLVQVES